MKITVTGSAGKLGQWVVRALLWHRQPLQARGDLLGQRVHVDLGAAAGRAGHDLQPTLTQTERFQDRRADFAHYGEA